MCSQDGLNKRDLLCHSKQQSLLKISETMKPI